MVTVLPELAAIISGEKHDKALRNQKSRDKEEQHFFQRNRPDIHTQNLVLIEIPDAGTYSDDIR